MKGRSPRRRAPNQEQTHLRLDQRRQADHQTRRCRLATHVEIAAKDEQRGDQYLDLPKTTAMSKG